MKPFALLCVLIGEQKSVGHEEDPFFPDVDSRFKFCVIVASPSPTTGSAHCAFFLQDVSELNEPEICFPLSAEDFARVNPNTGTAPVFRRRRDADLTTAIYGRLPVLVDRTGPEPVKAWPVCYATMFHMTNDSRYFRTRIELDEQEGAYPVGGNRFGSADGDWVPLYEDKMVQAYGHRAASVVVNPENQHRPAQPISTSEQQHQDPSWLPDPQFWVLRSNFRSAVKYPWNISYKMITATTNMRTLIAAALPLSGVGNSMGIMLSETGETNVGDVAPLMLGKLNSIPSIL